MDDLNQRLDKAEEKIKSTNFRKSRGLSNEVSYYFFDYPPEAELSIRTRIQDMQIKNNKGHDDFKLAVFDLYDIMIDTLEAEGFLEQCFSFEKRKGVQRIEEAVGNLLRINDDESLVVEHILLNTPPNAVVFLTGIGKCFPVLRAHKIMNNLHQAMDHVPVVMFYPGKWDGQLLSLFSEIRDGNYYRAFPLIG